MYLKYVFLLLLVVLTGCTTTADIKSTPEPRSLGKEYKTFVAPKEPASSIPAEIKEPTGIITLRQVLSLALINNPELAVFSWKQRESEAQILQASLLPNPELDIEIENIGGSGAAEGFDNAESTISLGQTIELGGKRANRRLVASLEHGLSAWDYEAKRLDVFTEATNSFIDLLASQERLKLSTELFKLAEETSRSVAERVRAGKVSPVDEAKAKIELAASRIELDRSKAELDSARKKLAAGWGGLPLFEKAEGSFYTISPLPSKNLLVERLKQNPDLARWLMETKHRRAMLNLEKSNSIVDLNLTGGLRQFRETNDSGFVVGISVPLQIFDRNQGNIQGARHRLAGIEFERKAAEVAVRTTLEESYQKLLVTYSELVILEKEILPGAMEAFEAATEGYRVGKFGYLDVLDAQRTLFESKEQYVEATAVYHRVVTEIERLTGEEIPQTGRN